MDKLPIESIEIILSCLPVKTLVRFKCVSKEWYNLINSQYFINLQLKRVSSPEFDNYGRLTNNHGLRILYPTVHKTEEAKNYGLYSATLRTDFNDDDELIIEHIPIDTQFYVDPVIHTCIRSYTEFVGSCNGIVCIRTDDVTGFALLNPSTRSYHNLPRLDYKYYRFIITFGFGFGYDHRSDDYKVVRVVRRSCRSTQVVDAELNVYSWRGKKWHTCSENILDKINVTLHKSTSAYSMNALHWFAHITGSQEYNFVIATFDLHLHKFHSSVLPLPDLYSSDDQLLDLKERLYFVSLKCLASYGKYMKFEINLWMLKDGEKKVKDSWCKLSNIIIDTTAIRLKVITYYPKLRGGDAILVLAKEGRLLPNTCPITEYQYFFVDTVHGKYRVFRHENCLKANYYTTGIIVPYVESLVTL